MFRKDTAKEVRGTLSLNTELHSYLIINKSLIDLPNHCRIGG